MPGSLRSVYRPPHPISREAAFSSSTRDYDPQLAEYPNDGIAKVELIPASGKVESAGILMVVILKGLAHEKDIPKKRVTRLVTRVIVPVSILVSTPVHKSSMYWAHKEMDG